jgi:hypothetical protein
LEQRRLELGRLELRRLELGRLEQHLLGQVSPHFQDKKSIILYRTLTVEISG